MSTYICEVCDVTEELEPDGAFNSGWDYPPFMGAWGVVGARTCPSCTIDKTAWFEAFTGRPDGFLVQLAEWERVILAKLDPVKTFEVVDACPVCESSAWLDAEGAWKPRPVVVQYRKSDPFGTAGGWCRVESCEAVWEDIDAIRLLGAQIGDDPAALLAFLRN